MPEPGAAVPTTDDDVQAIKALAQAERDKERANARQMVILIGGFLCWMFGAQLTTPARSEMLLLAFNNDTVKASALVGTLSSLSSMIGLFGNPLVGSLSDTLGRRPVLVFGSIFSVLRHGVWLVRPGVAAMVISDLFAPLSQVAMMVPGRSGIGDMYSKDPLRLSLAMSRWSLVPAVCTIVCPTLGGRLAAISPRLGAHVSFVRPLILKGRPFAKTGSGQT
jgi:MFS family permease